MAKSREELMEVRKQMIGQMEQKLHESWCNPPYERKVIST